LNSKISKVFENPSGPHHKAKSSGDAKAAYIFFAVQGSVREALSVLSAVMTVSSELA
jgi:hypothetical protein